MPTVLHRLSKWADEAPNDPAQRFKSKGEWVSYTASDYRDRVFYLALFLESKGFNKEDISVILSYNCPEWVHLDLAPLLLGGKSAGLYPNASEKDILYILNQTEAKVLSVQNKEYFQRITGKNNQKPIPDFVKLVIVFDGDTSISPKAVSYASALAQGKKLAEGKSLASYLAKIDPNAGAFMIYTSGTTGNPKGAVLSHDNIAFTTDVAGNYWGLTKGNGSTFSFLPLCHIAEKMQNIGVGISFRHVVNYCTKFENVATELPEVQPTLLLCVPRLWEKMMEGVQAKLKQAKGAKKVLAGWAFSVSTRVSNARYAKRMANPLDVIQLKIADKLVLSKIRKALGLSQAKLCASGAAALNAEVSKFFRILGVEILEVFGQTESTGVICMTEAGVDSLSCVGRPVPSIDFRIDDDGEICTRGRHIFKEYFKSPNETKDAIQADGWLHTGDLGILNDRGLIQIRGRKKEIMKTSGGKMVAPLPIEEQLKAYPSISQACMVGDGRKYFAVLVTLSEEWMKRLNGSAGGRVVKEPEILGEVEKCLGEVNQKLAGFERIKSFTVLSKEFSIDQGEMTPTLKMKRAVIESNYKDLIDKMYS